MSILNLGKLIDYHSFENYIKEVEVLPEIIHKYGKEFVVPDYPCWITYLNEGNIKGSISFTRHTYKHPILNKLCNDIIEILKSIFTNDISLIIERVHVVKTTGSIPIHRDEAGRISCINIGLKNASGAITHTSVNQTKESFPYNHQSIILENGYGYLVDTYQYHAVENLNDQPRYLITYGFGNNFEFLKNKLRENYYG